MRRGSCHPAKEVAGSHRQWKVSWDTGLPGHHLYFVLRDGNSTPHPARQGFISKTRLAFNLFAIFCLSSAGILGTKTSEHTSPETKSLPTRTLRLILQSTRASWKFGLHEGSSVVNHTSVSIS